MDGGKDERMDGRKENRERMKERSIIPERPVAAQVGIITTR